MDEAQRVAQTSKLSAEGQKNLKYGTRMLLLGSGDNSNNSNGNKPGGGGA